MDVKSRSLKGVSECADIVVRGAFKPLAKT